MIFNKTATCWTRSWMTCDYLQRLSITPDSYTCHNTTFNVTWNTV